VNKLSNRQFNILKNLVNAYIKEDRPISSKLLAKKYHPELSSATIRNEFKVLKKFGYIRQPHISAGSIPTDLGFKIFTSYLLEGIDNKITKMKEKLLNDLSPIKYSENFFLELTKTISDLSNSLAAISFENNFYKHGVSELFKNLVLKKDDDFIEIIEIAEDIENLEENFYPWIKNTEIKEPLIFIGEESPITKSENLSIIINKINDKENIFSLIIGPKRMNYDKNLAIIEAIEELF